MMSLNRCTHTIIYNRPFVLSFVTDPLSQFFQHPICLTVLLSGLKVRNSQLIPLSAGVAVKARDTGMTALQAFSEGWFKTSDARRHIQTQQSGEQHQLKTTPIFSAVASDNTETDKRHLSVFFPLLSHS